MASARVTCACGSCEGEWFRRGWECPEFGSCPDLRAALLQSLSTADAEAELRRQMAAAIEASRIEASASITRCTTRASSRECTPRSQRPRAQARAAQSTGRGERQQDCMICGETSAAGITPTGCGAHEHSVCTDCLRQYVTMELDVAERSDRRLEARRKRDGQLPCPGHANGCRGHLSDSDLRRVLPPALFKRYETAKRADAEHQRWMERHRNETDPGVLREALLREMPNAKMCRRCRYGPIEHYACDDLTSHHGEWRHGARIKNECPKCGWWARSSSEWPAWDGDISKLTEGTGAA